MGAGPPLPWTRPVGHLPGGAGAGGAIILAAGRRDGAYAGTGADPGAGTGAGAGAEAPPAEEEH